MSSWWNDFTNNALTGLTQPPFNLQENGSINGQAVDMKEAEEGLFAVVTTGAVQNNAEVYVALEESEDGTTGWTPVIDFLTGAAFVFADIGADTILARTFKRSKRFIRSVSTVGGGAGFVFTAVTIHGLRQAVNRNEPAS